MDRLAGAILNKELYYNSRTDIALRLSLSEFEKNYCLESATSIGIGKGCKARSVINNVYKKAFVEHDDNYIIGLLGEIYNIKEIKEKYNLAGLTKNAYTESIIKELFVKFHTDIFIEFNGEFAIAIWEKRTQTLYLISDHLGTRPIYYCCSNKMVAFDSDISALISKNFCDSEIDLNGVLELLTFEYIFKERTIYKNIKLIPPGTITRIKADDISFKEYFQLKINEYEQEIDFGETVKNFYKKIGHAVEIRLPDNNPLGLPLSGGLDSRTLAAIAHDYNKPVISATMGNDQCYDRIAAQKISKLCGFKHLGIPFDKSKIILNMEKGIDIVGGLTNAQHYHIFQIIDELSQYVSISFDGITPLGHNMIKIEPEAGMCSKNVNDRLLSILNYGFSVQHAKRHFQDDFFPNAYDYLIQLIDNIREKRNYQSIKGQSHAIFVKQRCRRFTIQGDQILRTNFVNRRPFMDKELVTFWMGLPVNIRDKYRFLKQFFIKFYPVLADVVYSHSGLPLSRPESIMRIWKNGYRVRGLIERMTKYRIKFFNKKAFFNYSEFYSNTLQKSPDKFIPPDNSPIYDYIQPSYVKKMAQEHLNGKVLHTQRFGLIFTLNKILSR